MWHFSLTTPIICPDLMTKFGVFIPDGFWWTKEGKVEAGFLFVPLSFWQLTKNADSEESECSSLKGMILPKNRLSYTHKKKDWNVKVSRDMTNFFVSHFVILDLRLFNQTLKQRSDF